MDEDWAPPVSIHTRVKPTQSGPLLHTSPGESGWASKGQYGMAPTLMEFSWLKRGGKWHVRNGCSGRMKATPNRVPSSKGRPALWQESGNIFAFAAVAAYFSSMRVQRDSDSCELATYFGPCAD